MWETKEKKKKKENHDNNKQKHKHLMFIITMKNATNDDSME